MVKITKRVVEAAEEEKDHVIWDDELPGSGSGSLVQASEANVIQYRIGGRSRRNTIGLHGARDCTPGGKGAIGARRRG